MAAWSKQDIPSQNGKLAVVTGAGGLGYETALALAGAGANVVVAGRNADKGNAAVAAIRAMYPSCSVRFSLLDLASLTQISAFAQGLRDDTDGLDLLINNAGVMALPTRRVTSDGFEMQLGTNHLGHFALTAHLLPLLQRRRDARIVTVTSAVHHVGRIHFDDLQLERHYSPWKAYGQSKLANLLFALELQRRSNAGQWGVVSMAAHPGYARTDLIANGPGTNTVAAWLSRLFIMPWASQSAAEGALPTLYAATAPGAQPGGFYGPSRLEMVGPPGPARLARQARDKIVAERLWDISETLTQTRFVALQASRDATRAGS